MTCLPTSYTFYDRHSPRLENVSLALILLLVGDDPIADDFVLYNTSHCDVYDVSLRLKYMANIEQWKNSATS